MLEYIGTVIRILLLCMLAGGSIALAVQSYKKRRYFWFGLGYYVGYYGHFAYCR